LLTPRIDYPPDPPVQRPAHERQQQHQQQHQQQQHHHRQQRSLELNQEHPQSPTSLHHHTFTAAPASQSHPSNNLTLANQQQYNPQDHQALLALRLPSHQQHQLLLLQQQLFHLQQLSQQQQLATHMQQEQASIHAPASPSLQPSTRLFSPPFLVPSRFAVRQSPLCHKFTPFPSVFVP
jgi:hypothetical protein